MTDRALAFRAINDLRTDPRNPKAHDTDTINDSISRFGYIEPIIEDQRTGYIVSGHGRLDVLTTMEAHGDDPPNGVTVADDGTWMVPVVTGWASRDDAEAGAALVALNRTTELGGWDDTKLVEVLQALTDTDYEFVGIGYTDHELEMLLRKTEADSTFAVDHGTASDEFLNITGLSDDPVKQRAHRVLAVLFVDEPAVEAFCKALETDLDQDQKQLWYPRFFRRESIPVHGDD